MPRVDIAEVRALLFVVIDDERAVERLQPHSPLYGALPDLDSIAVVNLMLAIEERFGVTIDDEEVEESLFATLGSLTSFVRRKVEIARPGGDVERPEPSASPNGPWRVRR